jgi:putative PEP-CTERM system histidine kinase
LEIYLSLGFISYLASGVAYLFLLIVYFFSKRNKTNKSFLLLIFVVLLWSVILTLSQVGPSLPFKLVTAVEFLRYFFWFHILHRAAGYFIDRPSKYQFTNILSPISVGILFLISLVFLGFNDQLVAFLGLRTPTIMQFGWMLGFSILGLLLVEQVIRNVAETDRHSIKLLCISAAALFGFDFFVFSNALLLQQIDYDFWSARGVVNVLVIPTLLLAAVRNPRMAPDIHISRKFVLHSTTLIAAGIYLLLMAIAGYYIKGSSAEWGKLAQAVFLIAALVLLAVLFLSTDIRARVKKYLSYSFQNKYDYRDEWDRFSRTILTHDPDVSIFQRAIQAAGQIVESKGGAVWIQDDQRFVYKASWKTEPVSTEPEKRDSPLIEAIKAKKGILSGDELSKRLGKTGEDNHWLLTSPSSWIVLPLMINEELFGFIHLERPQVDHTLDIEDIDLLNTVTDHVALALFLNEADSRLQVAQRFKDLDQMTAFLVHDLKTVFSQLSLLLENANSHKRNPEFIDDMIATVDHTTQKMQRLLEQLRNPEKEITLMKFPLVPLLEEIVESYLHLPVNVMMTNDLEEAPTIRADRQQLMSAIRHIVQNGVESVAKNGKVKILTRRPEESVLEIVIEDNGVGMTAEFIRNSLFKPFESTKGVSGMGVGVYQCRKFIRSLDGDVLVTSEPGLGTRFKILLPVEYE